MLNEDFRFVPTLNGSSIHRLYCIRLRANLNIHVLPQQNNSTWHIYIQTRTRFEQGPRRGNSHHQERFLWFIDTGTCRTLCSILHHCDITPGLMISVHYFSKYKGHPGWDWFSWEGFWWCFFSEALSCPPHRKSSVFGDWREMTCVQFRLRPCSYHNVFTNFNAHFLLLKIKLLTYYMV